MKRVFQKQRAFIWYSYYVQFFVFTLLYPVTFSRNFPKCNIFKRIKNHIAVLLTVVDEILILHIYTEHTFKTLIRINYQLYRIITCIIFYEYPQHGWGGDNKYETIQTYIYTYSHKDRAWRNMILLSKSDRDIVQFWENPENLRGSFWRTTAQARDWAKVQQNFRVLSREDLFTIGLYKIAIFSLFVTHWMHWC